MDLSGKENDFLYLKGGDYAHFDGIVSALVEGRHKLDTNIQKPSKGSAEC